MSRAAVRSSARDDSGAAMVEFLGLTLVVLIPLVYVIVAMSQIQAGAYAAESAARASARGAVVEGMAVLEGGGTMAEAVRAAESRARTALALTVEDMGVSADARVALACESGECFSPGSVVAARVDIDVRLPGVPASLLEWLPMTVGVGADAVAPVDGLVRP